VVKLDIACGQSKQEGYTGIDWADVPGVDIVHDLNVYPWPIETASVEVAFCSHYVEHIPMDFIDHMGRKKEAFFAFFDEVNRILVPGGQITIIAPWHASTRAWQDPTHRRAISDVSFLYLNKAWRDANKLDHYAVECDFDNTFGYSIEQIWTTRNDEYRQFAMRHHVNVINDVQATLIKRG
jgi:predicted SAM-dependent methyltransferase